MGIPYAEVIGDPIAHSKSPLIHNFWLRELGVEGDYRALQVGPDDLAKYFADRRRDPDWIGCNVTMPHKQAVLEHVDSIDKWARDTGAANCVSSQLGVLYATNTDVWGVSSTISPWKADGQVVVIGAGGAARAALRVLAAQGAEDVRLVVRDVDKGTSLLGDFGIPGRAHQLDEPLKISSPRMLINASPLGMSGKPAMPRTVMKLLKRMKQQDLVFDMIYDPVETALLAEARELNLHPVNGLGMLIDQARDSFDRLFGARPPLSLDHNLKQLLTR